MPPHRSPLEVPDGEGDIPISDSLAHWGKPLQISLVPVTLAPIRGIVGDDRARRGFGGYTLMVALVEIRFRWI